MNIVNCTIIVFQQLSSTTADQQRIPVPIAINVPNVPPPCSIALPTVFTSSRPRKPYLHKPNGSLVTGAIIFSTCSAWQHIYKTRSHGRLSLWASQTGVKNFKYVGEMCPLCVGRDACAVAANALSVEDIITHNSRTDIPVGGVDHVTHHT